MLFSISYISRTRFFVQIWRLRNIMNDTAQSRLRRPTPHMNDQNINCQIRDTVKFIYIHVRRFYDFK